MPAEVFQVLAWPTLGVALVVFGFAPGVALRMIVLFYERGNPRRQELLGELYGVPRIERPFWVAEQLEVALFEGLGGRIKRLLKGKTESKISAYRCPHCGILLSAMEFSARRLSVRRWTICPGCFARLPFKTRHDGLVLTSVDQ